MNVLNVVSVLSAREGGGNAERAFQLSRAITASHVRCTVLTLDIGNVEARREDLGCAELVVVPCLNKRFQIPFIRWGRLRDLVLRADIVHLMGYWSPLGVLTSLMARHLGVPYVICPAGALPLFGRSRLLKRAFNYLIGRRQVLNATGWIAVTASELPDFSAYGVDPTAVAIIPNGVEESEFSSKLRSCVLDNTNVLPLRFVLFMGRLNLIKGPDLLLEAFGNVAREFPDVDLLFAGPDEGMQALLMCRAVELGIDSRVRFIGFVTGSEKVALYRSAMLLVVPSRLEAMSIVAVEAGICGLPVLMTDQCGLNDIREIEPGLIVPANADELAAGLRLTLEDADRSRSWGMNWQAMVRERFLWADIGQRFSGYLAAVVSSIRH
jgi:glycosyltransferase involved in cell wall biosynthesis